MRDDRRVDLVSRVLPLGPLLVQTGNLQRHSDERRCRGLARVITKRRTYRVTHRMAQMNPCVSKANASEGRGEPKR
jgi:hypothetical protein